MFVYKKNQKKNNARLTPIEVESHSLKDEMFRIAYLTSCDLKNALASGRKHPGPY